MSDVSIILRTHVVATFGVPFCHKKLNRFVIVNEAGLPLNGMGTIY